MGRESGCTALSASLRGHERFTEAGSACAAARGYLALPETAAWACAIFFLCVTDAICTVLHIRGGATEINPIMDYLLAMGPQFFVATKVLISVVTLGVLCTLLPRIRRGRLCFLLIGVPYLAVCCYHLSGFVG